MSMQHDPIAFAKTWTTIADAVGDRGHCLWHITHGGNQSTLSAIAIGGQVVLVQRFAEGGFCHWLPSPSNLVEGFRSDMADIVGGKVAKLVDPMLGGVVMVELRNVYGNVQAYPANSLAGRLAELIGAKTLTPNALRKIEALGYELRNVTGDAQAALTAFVSGCM